MSEILDTYRNGASIRQTARAHGISPKVVTRLVHQAGISRSRGVHEHRVEVPGDVLTIDLPKSGKKIVSPYVKLSWFGEPK